MNLLIDYFSGMLPNIKHVLKLTFIQRFTNKDASLFAYS